MLVNEIILDKNKKKQKELDEMQYFNAISLIFKNQASKQIVQNIITKYRYIV